MFTSHTEITQLVLQSCMYSSSPLNDDQYEGGGGRESGRRTSCLDVLSFNHINPVARGDEISFLAECLPTANRSRLVGARTDSETTTLAYIHGGRREGKLEYL